MKRLLTATALVAVLCGSAMAGEIPIGGYAPPAPDEPTQTVNAPTPGDSPTGGYTESSTDITLSVVETLLSLLSF